MPRGLVFGAATVEDGWITRTPHINVSPGVVERGYWRGGGGGKEGEREGKPSGGTFPRRGRGMSQSGGREGGRSVGEE